MDDEQSNEEKIATKVVFTDTFNNTEISTLEKKIKGKDRMQILIDTYWEAERMTIKTIPGSLIAQGLSGLNAAKIRSFSETSKCFNQNLLVWAKNMAKMPFQYHYMHIILPLTLPM